MASYSRYIKAPKDKVFGVLADYGSYSDWTPDVVEATVLAAEGDIMVAEFFSPELLETTYQLEFLHSKPTSIRYKQVGQTGYDRGLEGSWHLADAQDRDGAIVTAAMSLNTNLFRSLPSRRMVSLILRRRLDVLEQMFSSPTAAECEDAGNDAGVMVVWFAGNKYLVRKAR